MKKYLTLLSVFFITVPLHARHEVYSRSFMFTKPAYPASYGVVMQQALWHDIVYNKKGSLLGGLQIIGFAQPSIGLKKSTRYFLFNKKNELLVAGDDTPFKNALGAPIRDVRAEWLGLSSTFRGTLSVNPKQQQGGFSIEYSQDLKKWFDVPILRDWYISITAPVVTVHNNIHLSQANVVDQNPNPLPAPQDIIQAFDQPAWCWGKMTGGQRKTNLAELRFVLGSSYVSDDNFQLNYDTILIIPVGKKQNAEYLFSPVVGNNHHMGVGGGVNFQIPLNKPRDGYVCCFILDLESVILIRNKQHRTFDLRGKPWSRFMLMNTLGAQPNTNIPGVNLLTYKATIKPFNMVDFAMGWRFKSPKVEFETGWGVWGHGYERVEHLKDINSHVLYGIAGTQPGTTAHLSTIEQQAPNDPYFVPITLGDIDEHSASNAGALNFRVFFSGGMTRKGETKDSVFGAGWSIDLPYKNSALQVWNVWVKLGATF